MTPATLLLRQIHPNFVQAGRVTSQAFRPTPKDEGYLSVDNGDLITPHASWQRFTANPAYASAGIMAVSFSECEQQALPVLADAAPYPEHCAIDYTACPKKVIEQKAKVLRGLAQTRGWLWQSNANGQFTIEPPQSKRKPLSKQYQMTQLKTALITGITGQDGAYLAERLLEKDCIVHCIKRRASSFNTQRADHTPSAWKRPCNSRGAQC